MPASRPVSRRRARLTALLLLASVATLAPSARAAVQSSLWVPNVFAQSIERVGGTVFLAGPGITMVGPYSGECAALSPVDGSRDPAFPEVFGISGGTVRCAVPDGSGGWFLGGEFSRVGGLARANLAHVAADRSVTAWNPGANGPVLSIALDAGVLWVGGNFTQLGGATRNRAGAVNAATGAVTAWNPNVSSLVSAVDVAPSVVYLGGLFSAVGGQARSYLAAVDRASGAVTSFNPGADGNVICFERAGNTLYVGGTFSTIGGAARSRVAALDATTGVPTAWNPGAFSTVSDLELEGGLLYLAGSFSALGGQPRDGAGAVDTLTGAVAPFAPVIKSTHTLYSISVEGGVAYVAGDIPGVGASHPFTTRRHFAAFDAVSGDLLPWNPMAGSTGFLVVARPGEVLAGGYFTCINGVDRPGIAALDLATGAALPFAPSFAFGVPRVLASDASRLFVGGDFSGGFSTPPFYLTSYDLATLAPTGWQPVLNGSVTALLVDGSTLYVAGGFSQADGQPRAGLAAFDIPSGSLLPWNPGGLGGTVERMVRNGSEVVVAGTIYSLGGQSRTRLASVHATTGAVTAWAPVIGGSAVHDVELAGGRLWIGGDFTAVEGQTRLRLAKLDAATHVLQGWNPGANSVVWGLEVDGNRVFVAGNFTSIGAPVALRTGLAQLDGTSGAASAWQPGADNALYDVELSGGRLFCGGPVTSYDGVGRAFFAALADPDATTGIAPALPAHGGVRLAAPAPNPTRGTLTLRFELPRAATVSLELFDAAGRRARTLAAPQWHPAGAHAREADLSGLAGGVYFARLRAGFEEAAVRVVVEP